MQVNSVNQNNSTSFKANVSHEFVNAAKNYYTKNFNFSQSSARIDRFMSKVGDFEKFGKDDIDVVYDKVLMNGKTQHVLYAKTQDMKPGDYIVLTAKDQFRKVLEKFTHINKYEFDVKTKDI